MNFVTLDSLDDTRETDDGGKRNRGEHRGRTHRMVPQQHAKRRAGILRDSISCRVVSGVFHQPAGHVGVVNHKDEVAGEDQCAPESPDLRQTTGRQCGKRPGDPLLRAAPQSKFRRQHRKTEQGEEDQIHEHKGRAAVLPRHERETPHVTQSHGAPRREHQKSQSRPQRRARLSSCLFHRK